MTDNQIISDHFRKFISLSRHAYKARSIVTHTHLALCKWYNGPSEFLKVLTSLIDETEKLKENMFSK